jgi:hypothetical protein
MQLPYLAVNVFCVAVFDLSWHGLRASTCTEADRRTSTLAMVNMTPLFKGFHHAFLADLVGIPLMTICGIHRSVGLITCGSILPYTMIVVSEASFPLSVPQNLFAVIVCLLHYILR